MGSATTPTTLAVPLTGTTYTLGFAEVAGATVLSGTIPKDDTIPQVTEGTQFLSVVITPNYVGSRVTVTVVAQVRETTNTGDHVAVALFKDGAANAVRTGSVTLSIANLAQGTVHLKYSFVTASLTPITFTVRGGGDAGTVTLNSVTDGSAVVSDYGSTISSWIEVTEAK